jgi:hypothetical protein
MNLAFGRLAVGALKTNSDEYQNSWHSSLQLMTEKSDFKQACAAMRLSVELKLSDASVYIIFA